MRYVIFGAGAVGGSIGGRLFASETDVVVVARGAHLEAIRSDGLALRTHNETQRLRIPAVGAPDELELDPANDVVLLATKSHQTEAALDALVAVAPRSTPVICAQNGVENERLALRRFTDVYGLCVMLPSTHLEPGVVEMSLRGPLGVLDLGRYPTGVDERAVAIAADLERAGFVSRADPAIMRRKYRKLVSNLGNAVMAACGPDADARALLTRATAEAHACFEAAGIDVATDVEDGERRALAFTSDDRASVGDSPVRRRGGSTWQSLARGAGTIETDFLNGEIVLLGRLHGVPTPVNEMLQAVADRLARTGTPPGTMTVADLEARLPEA